MEQLRRVARKIVSGFAWDEGMDAGRLFARIEQTFDLRVHPDKTAALHTLGDLVSLISAKLESTGWVQSRDALWRKVRCIVAQEMGLDERELSEQTRFVDDLNF